MLLGKLRANSLANMFAVKSFFQDVEETIISRQIL